jgi:IS30 family transposase
MDRAARPGPQPVPAATPLAPRSDLLRNRLEEVERGMLEWYASQGLSTHEIARHIGIHHTSVMRKLKKYQIFSNYRKAH